MPYSKGHREQVRVRIVESARRSFNRSGFEAVSINSIMEEAGLTRGGFYAYFVMLNQSLPPAAIGPTARLSPGNRVFRFGPFELKSNTGELSKFDTRIKLQAKPVRIRETLVSHPGELVRRSDLCQMLWPAGTFVDFESGLNTAVNRLRAALGDSADSPRYIETLPRLGYRFICPVVEVREASTPLTVARAESLPVPMIVETAQASPRRRKNMLVLSMAAGIALVCLFAYLCLSTSFLASAPCVIK